MAENKKSFVAYCDWESQLDLLSDDEAGKLFRHLLAFVNDKDPKFSPDERILKMAFEPIRLQLKRDLEKYEEVKRKRTEAGRSGGIKSGVSRSKSEHEEPNEANASFAKKIEANEAVNDNVTVNVNDTVTDILLEKETKEENYLKENPDEIFPETEDQDSDKISETEERKKVAQKKEKFKPPSVDEVQSYCNERKNEIQAYKFVNFYQSKGWKVGNQPMKDWKAAVRTWETKDKENGKSNSNNSNNGFNNRSGNSTMGQGRKVSAASILAREASKHFARNSEGGDFTEEAEVVG